MFVICALLFFILAVFVYLYDFVTAACSNLAFVLQDFNKLIQKHIKKRSFQVRRMHGSCVKEKPLGQLVQDFCVCQMPLISPTEGIIIIMLHICWICLMCVRMSDGWLLHVTNTKCNVYLLFTC